MAGSHRTPPWKEGKLLSVEVVEGLFTLAQMTVEPYVVFFDLFREQDEWRDVVPDAADVLFCHSTTRQFFRRTRVTVQPHLAPVQDYTPPEVWLFVDGARRVRARLPAGQREIIAPADEKLLVAKDIRRRGKRDHPSGIYDAVLETVTDIEQTGDAELTTVEVHPNLNERLRLCHLFGRNVDPLKEIVFERPLPAEYETFVDIVSGTVPLADLGY